MVLALQYVVAVWIAVAVPCVAGYAWSDAKSTVSAPSARQSFAMAGHDTKYYVHGGTDVTYGRPQSNFFEYDTRGDMWTRIDKPYGTPALNVAEHSMIITEKGLAVTLGGTSPLNSAELELHAVHVGDDCRLLGIRDTLMTELMTSAVGTEWCIIIPGNTKGSLVGDNPYRADTPIATAAVHSGIVIRGEVAKVRVVKTDVPNTWGAVLRNGLQSKSNTLLPELAAFTITTIGLCPRLSATTVLEGSYLEFKDRTRHYWTQSAVSGTVLGGDFVFKYERIYKTGSQAGVTALHSGAVASGKSGGFGITPQTYPVNFTFPIVVGGAGAISTAAEPGEFFAMSPMSDAACQVESYGSVGSSSRQVRQHTAVYEAGTIVVFGGITAGNSLTAAVLAVDTATWSWTAPTTSGTAPSARSRHAAAAYSGTMWVYGGMDSTNVLSDLHSLNMATWEWTQHSATGPGAIHAAQAMVFGESMYLWGGKDASNYLSGLHRLDLDTVTWSTSLAQTGTPAARGYFGAAAVSTGKADTADKCHASTQMYIFGGVGSGDTLLDSSAALTFPDMNYQFENISVRFDPEVFAFEPRTIAIAALTHECGNGLLSGGKIEIALPAAFATTVDRIMSAGRMRGYFGASDCNEMENPRCLSMKGPTDIQVNAGPKIIIDTRRNLLRNGGAEEEILDEWVAHHTWDRRDPTTAVTSGPTDAKFGYYWFQPATTINGSMYQDVDVSRVAPGATLHFKAYAAFVVGSTDTAKVRIESFLDHACNVSYNMTWEMDVTAASPRSTWTLVSGTMQKLRHVKCMRVTLETSESASGGAADVFFDDVFFGELDGNPINFGSTLFVRVSYVTIPESCHGASNWVYGLKTYLDNDADDSGKDQGETYPDNARPCLDKCHACFGVDVDTYECLWPGEDGRVLRFERTGLGGDIAETTCAHCSPDGSGLCSGFRTITDGPA